MKLKSKIFIVTMIELFLVIICTTNVKAAETKKITFKDENLYNAIVEELSDKIETKDNNTLTIEMTIENINSVEELDFANKQLSNITGLENFTNLKWLDLSNDGSWDNFYGSISDLKPLQNLTKLFSLSLQKNKINDISPLKNLTELTRLNLSGNQISDISILENLKLISDLSMSYNNISDISVLENLTKLMSLGMEHNSIKNINALSNLTDIYQITMANNQIEDISALKKLTKMYFLVLDNNNITDISSLENLTKMTGLYLSSNKIKDVSALKNMTELTSINLHDNQISKITPLTNLTKLVSIDLRNNVIDDASGLENLTSLTLLRLSNNKITDISALKNLTNLTDLYLDINKIKDISPLKNMTKLKRLELQSNQISDISVLENKTTITDLFLQNNKITNVDILEKFINLRQLGLSFNPITDASKLENITKNLIWHDYTDISTITIPTISDQAYTGKEIKPKLYIYLKEGEDYTLSYKNNIEPGRASILILGKGYYIGSTKVYFNIVNEFLDVSKSAYYYDSVKYCYENKIILGVTDTLFKPNNKLTRGQLVTILYRMEGSPKVGNNNPYADVKNDYYYNAVIWASNNKVVSGYGNGKFGPNDKVTRAQLATILWNYAKYKKINVSKKADISTYKDYNDTKKKTSYAIEALSWAVGNKVMSGTQDGKLNSTGSATRGQAAVMIANFCKNVRK